MNKLFLYIFILIVFFSCKEKEDELIPLLEINPQKMDFSNKQEVQAISISTNVNDWTARVAESGAEWCTVNIQNTGKNKSLLVSVSANEEVSIRETSIVINAQTLEETVFVRQIGASPAILTDKETYTVPYIESTISLLVTSNIEFEVSFPQDWIKPAASVAKAVEACTLRFTVALNETKDSRTGEIIFRQKDGEYSKRVIVEQAAYGYTPGDASEFGEDVKIQVKSATTSNSQSGEDINRTYDGNMETLFHSSYTNTQFPVSLTYEFGDVAAMDYLVYYPRSDGGVNGLFGEVEVWVKIGSSADFSKVDDYDFQMSNSPRRIDYNTPPN